MDLGAMVEGVLLKAAAIVGTPRIPFFFGSAKTTGVSALPSAVDMQNSLVTPDLKIIPELSELKKLIMLRINPSEMSITPYVRIEEVKTGGGRTYYHWLDSKNRAIEAYTLTMKGTTGSLLPGNPESKLKLYSYLKLRELTLEPYWFNGKDKYGNLVKTKNQQYIVVRTVGLPVSILFGGFYRKPITLTETAGNQYNIAWDFEFVIEGMKPDIYTLSKFVGANPLVPSIAQGLLGIGNTAQIISGGNIKGIGV